MQLLMRALVLSKKLVQLVVKTIANQQGEVSFKSINGGG